MTDHVIVTDDGPVRTIRMNRPEKKNALTSPMYDAMAEAIESASGASPMRCLLIAGVPGAFSAGNDLQDFLKAAMGGEGLGNAVLRFLYALARAERPLVAAVQGVAVGIGTTMLLHCDYVVAGDRCALLDAFRRSRAGAGSGIEPDRAAPDGSPACLRAAGDGPAARPRGAKACGIVNRSRRPTVEAEAMKAAQAIAALPPEGVAISRRLMRGAPDEIVGGSTRRPSVQARLQSPEARAAFEAFLSRKK